MRIRLGAIICLTFALDSSVVATEESSELYRLFARDLIQVTVFGEEDVTAERRIDAHGTVNLPLISTIKVAGMTLVEASETIRDAYIEAEIYLAPQISVAVVEHAVREVSVLGQVNSPGTIALPPEFTSINIVELISSAGGFTRIGKADGVRVTRKGADGEEDVFIVNVESLIKGRGSESQFLVRVGDIVFVPERVF
ncbi:MAG: polysaccharide biosynthesis/export family protein [Synoicihabitans sp.]